MLRSIVEHQNNYCSIINVFTLIYLGGEVKKQGLELIFFEINLFKMIFNKKQWLNFRRHIYLCHVVYHLINTLKIIPDARIEKYGQYNSYH